MTQFESAVQAAGLGTLKVPSVSYGTKDVDFFHYQLIQCRGVLRLFAAGLKVRGTNLKAIKAYYGLKGKTAKDCQPQLQEIIDQYTAAYPKA